MLVSWIVMSVAFSASGILFPDAAPVVMPQCQPPNNCSVHVFRVRLSHRPDDESTEHENTTIVSVVQSKKYGSNYFEIKGSDMTEKLTKEIMQNMPANTDPRLVEKIVKNEFYLKPVGRSDGQVVSGTIPPPPPVRGRQVYQNTNASSDNVDQFPFVLVSLLLCIGIVLGILCTAMCLFIADMRKEPKFDRSNVVTYRRSIEGNHTGLITPSERRPMIRRPEMIEMIRQGGGGGGGSSMTGPPSQASTIRTGPTPNGGRRPQDLRSDNSWRQVSL